MKQFTVLMAFVLGAFIVVVSTAQETPHSVRIPDEHDWGTQRLPKSLFFETEIPIENIAKTGVVTIAEIKPGCGCTTVDPDKKDIQPGEKATVKIKLNVTQAQGGPISKSVLIRTVHKGDTTLKVFMLKVNLVRAIAIAPSPFVAFNNVPVGEKSVATITFTNPSDNTVTITNLVEDAPLTSSLKEGMEIKPHEVLQVMVYTKPEKSGQVYGAIHFDVQGNGDTESFVLSAYGTTK